MLKFFNNLSIRARLLLSLSLFLLTLGVASIDAYKSIGSNVTFAAQEKKGDAYQRPLADVMSALGKIRFEAARASVKQADENRIAAEVETIHHKMSALKGVQEALGADLQFTEEGLKSRGRDQLAYNLVAEKWNTLAKNLESKQYEGIDAAIASYMADIRGMIAHSGDTSNLILDPDLDSYYLMDITLLALPQTLDRLSVIASTVYPQIADGRELSKSELTEIAVMARMLSESDLARVDADKGFSVVASEV